MAQTFYDILYKQPKIHKFETYQYIEELAKNLCDAGLLKIDAEIMRNFVRYTNAVNGRSLIFSAKELTIPRLLSKVVEKLLLISDNQLSQEQITNIVKHLRYEMNKFAPIPYDVELTLAKILVQSAHPAIIQLIIYENVDVFLTYGYEVGDVLDVYNWNIHGANSGMQTTEQQAASIYIAIGGNPLAKTSDDPNDKEAALKRMMIIAAQEIAHFGDIIRSKNGDYIDRYSMDWRRFRTKMHIREARAKDLANLKNFANNINIIGLKDLALYTEKYNIVKKYRSNSFIHRYVQIKFFLMRFIFINRAYRKNMFFIAMIREKNIATYINKMIIDMEFNLDPQAEVYKKDDPEQEEAIACAEALARIPQQELKWGKGAVKYLSPNLYQIFYKELIPGCIVAYENIAQEKFSINYEKPSFALVHKFMHKINEKFMEYFKK